MIRQIAIVTLAIALLSSARAADSETGDAEKLQASLKKWQQLKEDCGGNYSYKIHWSSFVGFGHDTEVVVRDNKVVERRYRAFDGQPAPPVPVPPGQPQPEPAGKTWVEKGEELGQHQEGAPPKTLDELYAQAAEVVKRELAAHERRYVRFDKQGLLRSCFTIDTRIADDAPINGVTVSSITLGKQGSGKTHRSPSGKPYPAHWGEPPRIQTRDLRPLPGGYGRGSGTLARWIQKNLDRDAKAGNGQPQ